MILNKDSKAANRAILDVIFICFFTVSVIIPLLLTLINPDEVPDATIEKKAELYAAITWKDKPPCDIDTYVLGPEDTYVFYKHKEGGLMNLDRDDRGRINETVGDVTNEANEEIWTLRTIAPGKYIMNVHIFNCPGGINNPKNENVEVPVTIRFVKLNPVLKKVYEKDVTLVGIKDEETVLQFEMKDNEFTVIDDETFFPIVEDLNDLYLDNDSLSNSTYYSPSGGYGSQTVP